MIEQKFTDYFRLFIANNVISNSTAKSTRPWRSGAIVEFGDSIIYKNSVYYAANRGITLKEPREGVADDGVITWVLAESYDNKIFGDYFYFFIGKKTSYDDERVIPTVDFSKQTQYQICKDIVSLVRVKNTNISFGVPRVNWQSGNTYHKYTDAENQKTPFYAMNQLRQVFICLDNANLSPSTSEPIGESLDDLVLSDGYTWKYLMTIDLADEILFLTETFLPIKIRTSADTTVQWQVQENANRGRVASFEKIIDSSSVYGALGKLIINDPTDSGIDVNCSLTPFDGDVRVIMANKGTGYTKSPYLVVFDSTLSGTGANFEPVVEFGKVTRFTRYSGGFNYYNATAIVIGDGTGCTVTPELVGASVYSLNITSSGDGYTWAKVIIVPGSFIKVYRGILEPIKGLGKNAIADLRSSSVIINLKLPKNTYFTDDVSFRQVGLMFDARDKYGTLATEDFYMGESNENFLVENGLNKIDAVTGYIMYVCNSRKIERNLTQEENIRLVVNF